MHPKELALSLFERGAILFGSFLMKSGARTPIYVDLRSIISYPSLLAAVGQQLYAKAPKPVPLVCGVPYTAIPFAAAISLSHQIPMILKRKEKKEHGTGKLIEGVFHAGQECLLIEDVVTTGGSLLETVQALRDAGLTVRAAVALVDREQGGKERLSAANVQLASVLQLPQMVRWFAEIGKISPLQEEETLAFLNR
jgi:uridine monophosphate synthetase